jgi:hypothetical protein
LPAFFNLSERSERQKRRDGVEKMRQIGTFFAKRVIVTALLAWVSLLLTGLPARAGNTQYTMQEIVDAGHGFFGSTSGGLAKVVEKAFERYGLPNGYILGQEGGGAFIAGATYEIGRAHV